MIGHTKQGLFIIEQDNSGPSDGVEEIYAEKYSCYEGQISLNVNKQHTCIIILSF